MKGKLLFVAGAAVGYVLGARAGRKRYEQIRGAAERIWETPGVQNQVEQVKDFAAQRVGDIPSVLADGAQKAFTSLVSSRKNPPRAASKSASAGTSSSSSAAKPGTSTSTSAKKAAGSTATKSGGAKSGGSSAKKAAGSTAKPASGSSSTRSTRAKSTPAADSE